MTRLKEVILALIVLQLGLPLFAQGVLLSHRDHRHWPLPRPTRPPRPESETYTIKEITVDTRIEDQVARTQVSQTFVNPGSRQIEASFVFPLPYDGAIDRMTFMVDGVEYEAKLMTKEEARSIYEGYMRRNQDPALLEWMGTGMFKTSVFPIPAGKERKVTLRYTQLLRKDAKLTDYLFPLSTAKYTSKPIANLSFNVAIQSKSRIKSVYSPTHSVNINRSDDQHAVVSFNAKNHIPETDFRLFFDTAKDPVGASVLSYWPSDEENGYFLMLASPEIKSEPGEVQKKTAIFVIDRSGSMNGKKIEQAKEALRYVVNNLREGDLFNIIAYDSEIETFKPELQRYNDETRKLAIGFINSIFAGGSTNIDDALKTAFAMVKDRAQPNYVVFLTDGRPTAGERNEAKIAQNSERENKNGCRLISFGVGYDVNSRLMDRLSRANRGQSEFVRPDEDIEEHVSRLYAKIAAPAMVDVDIDIDLEAANVESGSPTNRVYPKKVHDLFKGQQLVLVGRYNAAGAAKIKIAGSVNGKQQTFTSPGTFESKSGNQTYSFVEKIWASRRIGEIIDQLDLDGKNQELINELVALSLEHGIITPYTSFLADDQSRPESLSRRGARQRTESRLHLLEQTAGQSAFQQRLEKKSLSDAARIPRSSNSKPRANFGNDRFGRNISGGLAADAVSEAELNEDSGVIHIGKDTLYRRGKTLIAANARDVDIEKQKDTIVEVAKFSDDYFALIKANTKSENAILATQGDDEELIIRLRQKVYRIK